MNAASYALPGLPNSNIAQGSMFVIFGTGLGPAQLNQVNAYPLPPTLAGTSVKVTVGSTTVDAYMVYTSAGQVAAIMPSSTPTGIGTVTVTYNGQAGNAAPVTVVQSSFGVFTLNQAGSGPSIVQNVISETDRPVNTLTQSARPGQYMILWGTGLGPTTANEAGGPVPGDIPVNVEVYVGGRPATVTYKGRSGCCAGIDQIIFIVPEGIEGCYVPVVVKTGDIVSNFSTLAVSATGTGCQDVSGISGEEIQLAQTTGQFRVGYIGLTRSQLKMSFAGQNFESKTDTGYAGFNRFDLNALTRASGLSGSAGVSMGACTLLTYRYDNEGSEYVDPIQPQVLDAGPVININGPRGAKQLTKEGGYYAGQLGGGMSFPGGPAPQPDYLEAGNYRIDNGSGGSGPNAVGAFTVELNMPQMLTWTNENALSTVNRAQGQQITWSGGDPNGYVHIMGISTNDQVAGMFICTERTSAGSFTIPSYVLSTLPATSGESIGFLSVNGVTASKRFTATNLDAGYVSATAGTQKTVDYR